MCIFSQPVEFVTGTKIFARLEGGSQFIVYEMTYSASQELAMVLPLPVPRGASEDALTFISLKSYPDFFADMISGFPSPLLSGANSSDLSYSLNLKVHDVGDFEASFVPGLSEFNRLDPRFRLSDRIWTLLPQYSDFGFAVFKLRDTRKKTNVHPMAFEFSTRLENTLFFPTIHIHDRRLPERAQFSHTLFCQSNDIESLGLGWQSSFVAASVFMKIDESHGILDANRSCFCKSLVGEYHNTDIFVG